MKRTVKRYRQQLRFVQSFNLVPFASRIATRAANSAPDQNPLPQFSLPNPNRSGEYLSSTAEALTSTMARKGAKEASHHHFFSLRGKKKEGNVKKGLGEALGAIGLRPEDESKCARRPGPHWNTSPVSHICPRQLK